MSAGIKELEGVGMDRSRQLANEHWCFLEKWMQMAFVDGFIHGYKHGQEDEREKPQIGCLK